MFVICSFRARGKGCVRFNELAAPCLDLYYYYYYYYYYQHYYY